MSAEQLAHRRRLRVAEAVDDHVGGGERPVAQIGPRRDLECIEAFAGCPRADVGKAASGETGGEEPEFHAVASFGFGSDVGSTSSQECVAAERSTVSVIRAALTPSAKLGRPSTASTEPASMAR